MSGCFQRRDGVPVPPRLRKLCLPVCAVMSPASDDFVDGWLRRRAVFRLRIVPISLSAIPGTGDTAAARHWRTEGGDF